MIVRIHVAALLLEGLTRNADAGAAVSDTVLEVVDAEEWAFLQNY